MTNTVQEQASAANRYPRLIPHLIAALLALLYAWLVSNTRFVTTGMEFVSPLAIILAVHLAWIWAVDKPPPGFAQLVLGRALVTALGIVIFVVLVAASAPPQAEAASRFGGQLAQFIAAIACLAVLAGVVFAAAAVAYLCVRGLIVLVKSIGRWFGGPPGSGGGRLNDFGYISLALLATVIASLEGMAPVMSFPSGDRVGSTVEVAAAPEQVWREIAKATSPDFPLPVMLKSIPQPVAVILDEGADLGAKRNVHFKGREGEGNLVLEVTHRTPDEVTFSAVSDTSPISKWVHQRGLTFRVEPNGTGSRLTVSSDYDRLLSPAWFFRPYIRLASYLAVNVLAQDTKARAESR